MSAAMELQRPLEPLPSLQEHDPAHLILPAVPHHDIGPAQKVQLPCLRQVLSSEFDEAFRGHSRSNSSTLTPGSTTPTPLLPRIEPLNDILSPLDRTDSRTQYSSSGSSSRRVSGHYERGRTQNGLSMDDDVRIAAEALSGLGHQSPFLANRTIPTKMDLARSPTQQSFQSSPAETLRDFEMQIDKPDEGQEPLLRLVAQAHPWVGGTINGSIHAYNTTLHYSPHFIKYGANLVEKTIAAPMASTVGSVGRITGVEDGLRRYLGGGGRQPSDLSSPAQKARFKAALEPIDDAMDIDFPSIGESRRTSFETLPAYAGSKPPSYREEISPTGTERARSGEVRTSVATTRSWPSQVAGHLFVTTSGLGIALSITSRRSLQYCLSLLSQATEHVATVTNALRMVLEQYDQARVSFERQLQEREKGGGHRTPDQDEASRRLAELIKHHCDDIWQTLKNVVNSVSTAAGGALPDNARDFVRTQLMSLPQRWQFISTQQSGEGETSRGAHRMIAFATEGLEMMSQVSQVVRATLASAESWLDRVGRRDVERTTTYNEKDQEMINGTLRGRPA